jgi:hypothetical protein
VPIRKFTTEKHAVRADWLEPAWSSAGKHGRVRLAWTDRERSADFDNSKHHAAQEPRRFAGLIFS